MFASRLYAAAEGAAAIPSLCKVKKQQSVAGTNITSTNEEPRLEELAEIAAVTQNTTPSTSGRHFLS